MEITISRSHMMSRINHSIAENQPLPDFTVVRLNLFFFFNKIRNGNCNWGPRFHPHFRPSIILIIQLAFFLFSIFYFSILLAREFQPEPSFLSLAHSHFVWLLVFWFLINVKYIPKKGCILTQSLVFA